MTGLATSGACNWQKAPDMDYEYVKRCLPQKFPFIMIDAVLELTPNERITCIKNITGNEFIFCGHFPEKAIFPGAYITEALAQASILLFQEMKTNDNLFLLCATKMRFKKQVIPGDQLVLRVNAKKCCSTGAIVDVEAAVEDQIAAIGELTFGIQKIKNHNVGKIIDIDARSSR